MNKANSQLQGVFEGFETKHDALSESDVADAIRKRLRALEESNETLTDELRAEWMAFSFMANYPQGDHTWGTYFGPKMVWQTDNGQTIESPSIKDVTPEITKYWHGRLEDSRYPVIKARYADLLWDFAGEKQNVHHAQVAIDSYVDAIGHCLYGHALSGIAYSKRALNVAIAINDIARIQRARDAMIELEQRIRKIESPGTWGFAFDTLIDEKKSLLTELQRDALVNDMEEVLKSAVGLETPQRKRDPFLVEHAATRLAAYYRKTNQLGEARRVLQNYLQAFRAAAKTVGPLQGHGWLRRVYNVLVEYGMNAEAEQLAPEIAELGTHTHEEMGRFSVPIQFPEAEVEKFLDALTKGELNEVLQRIAGHFTPNPKRIEDQVKELAKVAPFMSLVRTSIIDPQGRDIAAVGSVEDDLQGRVVMQMSQNLTIEGFFLRAALERSIEKLGLDAQNLLSYCFLSPVFQESRESILRKGFEAYFGGDWISAVYLLVPQIEHALRQLLTFSHRPVFKPGRHGGLNLRSLDDILSDAAVVQVFGEDVIAYLKVLLTDQRGWNLRNDLCHGIMEPDAVRSAIADRVLHVFLLLGTLRVAQDSTSHSPATRRRLIISV